jgi:hypothetical protein
MSAAGIGRQSFRLALGAIAAIASFTATAENESIDAPRADSIRWYFQTSVYTRHYRADPGHNNHQNLFNVERWAAEDYALGAALFDNSFGQPTQYLYVGKLWRPLDAAPLHVKLTGGVMHGYKDEYRDKVPHNTRGIAPVILPSVGLSGRRYAAEAILLWRVGAMFTVGVYLD